MISQEPKPEDECKKCGKTYAEHYNPPLAYCFGDLLNRRRFTPIEDKAEGGGHTLGPWYAVNYAGYIHIQDTPLYDDSNDLLNESECPQAEENGKLIAAAPATAAERDRLLKENATLREKVERLGEVSKDLASALDETFDCLEEFGMSEETLIMKNNIAALNRYAALSSNK